VTNRSTALIRSAKDVQVDVVQVQRQYFAKLGTFDHWGITVGEAMVGKPILELTDAEARGAFEVRAADPHISRAAGSITLVSGLSGQRATPGRGIFAGVLGGLEGMVKNLGAELGPVRVNGVCAGD
jgi:hypothetical protein